MVYRHAPGADVEIEIDLCLSGYDTKVYVYENDSSTLVACNDDACGSDGSQFEGEPECFDGYKDAYNGGCDSTPPVFSYIFCDINTDDATMCGEYGGFFHNSSGFDYRDTDWYFLEPTASPGASVTAVGQYPSLFGYIDAAAGCGAPFFEDFLSVGICEPANFVLGGNPYWFFAATSGFGSNAGACGGNYTITLENYDGPGCSPFSVEAASWSAIKGRYSPHARRDGQ